MAAKLPFRYLRAQQKLSEQKLAEIAHVSRMTLRHIEKGTGNPTVQSLARVATALGRSLSVQVLPRRECSPEHTVVMASYKVVQDGFSSWKIHFMDLVDEFYKTADPRIFVIPPVPALPFALKALIASITWQLTEQTEQSIPDWARRLYFLDEPWFVSEMESLKAMAIVESPLAFRRNNIFVQENFLQRA